MFSGRLTRRSTDWGGVILEVEYEKNEQKDGEERGELNYSPSLGPSAEVVQIKSALHEAFSHTKQSISH